MVRRQNAMVLIREIVRVSKMTLEMMADDWWRIESLSWMFYVERETTNEPG